MSSKSTCKTSGPIAVTKPHKQKATESYKPFLLQVFPRIKPQSTIARHLHLNTLILNACETNTLFSEGEVDSVYVAVTQCDCIHKKMEVVEALKRPGYSEKRAKLVIIGFVDSIV